VRTFIFEQRNDFPEILAFVRGMDARYGLRLEELQGDFRAGLASLIRRSGVKAIVLGTRRRRPRPRPGRAWAPQHPVVAPVSAAPEPVAARPIGWDALTGVCCLLSMRRARLSGTAHGTQLAGPDAARARRGDPNAEGQDLFCPSSAGWPAFMRVNPVLDWGYADVWALLRAAAVPYCALYDRGFTSIGSTADTRPNRCPRPGPAAHRASWAPLPGLQALGH
jgi:hypothetical protein